MFQIGRSSRLTRYTSHVTRLLLTSLCGCWLLVTSAWPQSLEVIELKNRTAEDVIPILQPLLEPGGALTGENYTLFVRTSPANLRQLRTAVAQIDRKPRQLLISVRQDRAQDSQREGVSASGTIRTERGGISANESPRARSGVTVRGTQSHGTTRGGGVASVSVLEGSSAFIASGTSVPIVTMVAAGGGRRPWGAAAAEYRDLSSGFLVTPRVNGDGVVLDIEQRTEQLRNSTIDRQALTTQIAARLGEWVQLGGIEQSASSTQSGMLSREYSTSSDSRGVWVKVEMQ